MESHHASLVSSAAHVAAPRGFPGACRASQGSGLQVLQIKEKKQNCPSLIESAHQPVCLVGGQTSDSGQIQVWEKGRKMFPASPPYFFCQVCAGTVWHGRCLSVGEKHFSVLSYRVTLHEKENLMSAENLGIVFGPTLMLSLIHI